MFNKIKSFFKDITHLGVNKNNNYYNKFFKEHPLHVLDTILKLNDDASYVDFIRSTLHNKFGRLKGRYKMPLYVRYSIMSYDIDEQFAMTMAEKARRTTLLASGKVYTRHDIMLFYCTMARYHAVKGNNVHCILSLNQLEKCLLDCDLSHPTVRSIQRRAASFLSVICKVKHGSYIEEANNLVSPSDISDLLSIDKSYRVLNVAFKMCNNKNNKLYKKIVQLYNELENPLCGPYQRGEFMVSKTKCINEFFLIYTDEPCVASITDDDITQIENKYPGIRFNRNNLKFYIV